MMIAWSRSGVKLLSKRPYIDMTQYHDNIIEYLWTSSYDESINFLYLDEIIIWISSSINKEIDFFKLKVMIGKWTQV